MRFFLGVIVLLASLAPAGFAEEHSGLRKMVTGNDSRGWEAVGRLNIAGGSMCTGALIAPDLVLTAAHCMYDRKSRKQVDATTVEFLAGWRSGRATAYARVKRAVVHPDYTYAVDSRDIRVRNDVAVLQLSRPIRKTSITPFATGPRPRKGATVGVVSYARGRSDSPSIEESCRVLARQSGNLIMSCDVNFGSSGAPVFDMEGDSPKIVSVISAMQEMQGRKVALGMSLAEPLAVILGILKETEGPFQKVTPTTRRIILEEPLDRSGAKFVRP